MPFLIQWLQNDCGRQMTVRCINASWPSILNGNSLKVAHSDCSTLRIACRKAVTHNQSNSREGDGTQWPMKRLPPPSAQTFALVRSAQIILKSMFCTQSKKAPDSYIISPKKVLKAGVAMEINANMLGSIRALASILTILVVVIVSILKYRRTINYRQAYSLLVAFLIINSVLQLPGRAMTGTGGLLTSLNILAIVLLLLGMIVINWKADSRQPWTKMHKCICKLFFGHAIMGISNLCIWHNKYYAKFMKNNQ